MINYQKFFPVEQLPLDSCLLAQVVKPRCVSLTDDQSARVKGSEIEAAHVAAYGIENFLGLGLFKFPIVLPFALICFLRSKWRLMAGFAAAASLLGVLSVIAVGPAGVRSYANLLIDIVRNPDNPAYSTMRAWDEMPTVKGVFATLLTGRLATVYISVLTAVVSAPLVLFVAWRWRQEDRGRGGNSSGLMFAAALAVSQVAAPHMYAYDLTLMLLAVLLVIGSSQWSEESGQRVVLTAIIVILYCPPVYTLLLRWNSMYILAAVLVAFALAAISLARKIPHEILTGDFSRIDGRATS